MIKVGQIWRGRNNDDTIVITHIDKTLGKKQEQWQIDYMWADGETVSNDDAYFVKTGRKLIAEYPTWQEAVNSKEFKVGEND